MDYRTEWNHLKPSHPSDIADLEEKDDQTSSRWHCGNPRRRREVVSNFAKSSSVHGAAYVCSSGRKSVSLCIKITYRVLFSICFLAVISNVMSLLQENFSKQATFINTINRDIETGYEEDPEYFPLYPRITICRRPFYRTGFNDSHLRLVEYAMLSLGYPFTPLTLTDKARGVELIQHQTREGTNLSAPAVDFQKRLEHLEKRYKALKATEQFDIKEFVQNHSANCSEVFSSCIVLVFVIECCKLFDPVLTSDGLCFTIGDVSPIAKFVLESPLAFSVVLDLATPPALNQQIEKGFRVYLTDPSEEIPVLFDDLDGQDVVPGLATSIKANLIKRQRTALHTPWHGMWDNCPTWKYNETYESDRFSHLICPVHFHERRLREKCECQTFLEGSSPSTLRFCDPIDMLQCSMKYLLEKNITFMASCEQPCTVYSYKTESSYIKLGGDGNISRVEIMYNAKQFTYNEYRKATLSSLFSQIGGSLGLYLGASLITLVEIVTFTATWLWYRLAPAKVANISAKGPKPRHTPLPSPRTTFTTEYRNEY